MDTERQRMKYNREKNMADICAMLEKIDTRDLDLIIKRMKRMERDPRYSYWEDPKERKKYIYESLSKIGRVSFK